MEKNKKMTSVNLTTIIMLPMEPPEHPSEHQEDPINGDFEKTIEITPWGPDWR